MRKAIATRRYHRLIAVSFFLTLGGCGQKGPLYLPEKKAATSVTQAPINSPANPASMLKN